MSDRRALGTALVVALFAAFVAFGGQPAPWGEAKALVVAAVCGWIAYRASISLSTLADCQFEIERLTNELSGSEDAPALHELRVLAAQNSGAAQSDRVCALYLAPLHELLDQVRAFIPLASRAGLIGVMAGLVVASIRLEFLKYEYASVAAIAAWGGGALVSALVGYGASTLVAARLMQADQSLLRLKAVATSRAVAALAPGPQSPEERIAELVAKTVAESLKQGVEIWDSLTLAAKSVQSAATSVEHVGGQLLNCAERLAEQNEVSNRVAWQLNSSSTNIAETSKSTAEAGKLLYDLLVQLAPIFRGIQAGVESLDHAVATVYPAMESARDLHLTIKAADLVFKNIDGQVAGIAASIHDEMSGATAKLILNQQQALTDGIGPPLKTIAHSMDLLMLLIDRSEQLLRNLPLAVPAKRIVDDLAAAGAAHLAGAERDAKTVEQVAAKLAESEAKMDAVLNVLRKAHLEIASALTALHQETTEVAVQVQEITEHMEGPFWKKLGGKKP